MRAKDKTNKTTATKINEFNHPSLFLQTYSSIKCKRVKAHTPKLPEMHTAKTIGSTKIYTEPRAQ